MSAETDAGAAPCRLRRGLIAATLAVGVSAGMPARAAAATRTVALNFDDLPYAAGPFPESLAAATRVTHSILGTLKRHRAPAMGMVNAARLEAAGGEPAWTRLLEAWIHQGASLGGHTYSHADLNLLEAQAFESEIARGQVVVDRLSAGRGGGRYFRFPCNHTGPTAEKKQAVAAWLTAQGLRIAPHTIDSGDYIFDLGYVDSLRRGDRETARRLREAYVEFVMAATGFAETIAPQVVGRDIPQIALFHGNDITADCLEPLLLGFEHRGYRFVSMDEAMADPAYDAPDTLVTGFGPTWLWRWRQSRHLHVAFDADPEPPAWVTELHDRVARLPHDAGNKASGD
jgi:peptidoglycan/xylan/chitin deacetylase (PgdA/CDA1 family)